MLRNVISVLPSDFDCVLDQVSEDVTPEKAVKVLRTVYPAPDQDPRDGDVIIAECVRN